MSDFGVYKPDDARLVLQTVRYLLRSGFLIQPPGREGQFVPPEAPLYVRNDSGEEIPPFAIVQIDEPGTVEKGGQNYITVKKPNSSLPGGYLFNGIATIETDGFGVVHAGPVVRVLTDGSTVAVGDTLGPEDDQWHVKPGGDLVTAIGPDDIETDVVRAFAGLGSNGGGRIQYEILSLGSGTGAYDGLISATVTVRCGPAGLIGQSVTVIDHSGCIFDEDAMAGYTGWAFWGRAWSLDPVADCETLTPAHWIADNRCCAPDTGTYADGCQ